MVARALKSFERWLFPLGSRSIRKKVARTSLTYKEELKGIQMMTKK